MCPGGSHSTSSALRLAAVSPTTKSIKIQSDSANNVMGKQLPLNSYIFCVTCQNLRTR